MTCGNITRLETKIAKLEEKETLTEKERQTVSKVVKKLEALSVEFKTYHYAILDQTKDQDKLTEEQVILDDNEDIVKDLMELYRGPGSDDQTCDASRIWHGRL